MDRELLQHKQWLGLLQPTGLVVSPPALTKAGICVNRDVIELQQDLQELTAPTEPDGPPAITDFVEFATGILNWEPEDLIPQNELPPELSVPLPEYGETLKPTYGVPGADGDNWIMLVQVLAVGEELDLENRQDACSTNSRRWQASPQARLERLLRETEVPVGLLCNGTHLRLVYAPRGESSGFVTFPVGAMCEVSGRLILGAMEMLLCGARVLSASEGESLADLLRESRQYQNEVSVKLADQVLGALWELLRGFQAADAMVKGGVLGDLARDNPQHIYGGLITTLLRLVFLLYAEDEGLMPGDRVYTGNYSVTRLFEKLQQDAGNYPDTMDQRYGAWPWLVTLFRLVYEGGGHVPEYLPARHGELFDPETYQFLAGVGSQRNPVSQSNRVSNVPSNVPRVADGVVYRVLRGLLIVDGERLSYRSLDVEHIGSVYEAVMGYEVKRAAGTSIGVWSKPTGAKVSVTVVVDTDKILETKANDRNKLLDSEAGCKLSGNAAKELKAAKTADDIVAALGRRVSPQTPVLLPAGSLYLQPTEERRRSGSHYTPRAMTEPIVRDALAPVLASLGDSPTPEQILSLKICDLAMGSGAFLVESCRQLAEVLVKVEQASCLLSAKPPIPNSPFPIPNSPEAEEPLLVARRIIAQRCLYGVDKNPFAVSLAKLSLWLVTLAKNQPFTFLDHALKCGDSLVGLTVDEIKNFNYPQNKNLGPLFAGSVDNSLNEVRVKREEILAREDRDYDGKKLLNDGADSALETPRNFSKLIIASFFSEGKKKARQEKLEGLRNAASLWRQGGDFSPQMTEALEFARENEVKPFNWHLEFPEVFESKNPGFDVIVGNPPFIGGSKISSTLGSEYLDWLKEVHPETHGNGDLVAHFFRRAFNLVRQNGTLGLIATNTISQGDTRATGLRFICNSGGTIYRAIKRKKWEGAAAVVVSVVHIFKGVYEGVKLLDEKEVPLISAFLFHSGGNDNPKPLLANADKSFLGSKIYGQGLTFDDTTDKATPIAEMERLIKENPKNKECIFPYIGGSEVNSSPTHEHHRYVINFKEMSEVEAREYPDLMKIVEEKVKPERDKLSKSSSTQRRRREFWWQYGSSAKELYQAIAPLSRVLVVSRVRATGFTFLPAKMVFSEQLVVFTLNSYTGFSVLQSRIHEIWAMFFSSTAMDLIRYTPTDCFQTFPFPANWETDANLEEIGKTYYQYRAQLMEKNNQGLTETYNRFHDPGESHPDIKQLRQLHTEMDAAILKAYGWQDIPTDCGFYLDYEEELEEEEGSNRRSRKKPYRYRWPDEVADELLLRLLKLNEERYEEEELGGKAAAAKAPKSKGGGKKKSKKEPPPSIPGFNGAS